MTNTPDTDTDIDELLLGLLDFSPARFQRQMKDGTIKQLSGMDVFNEAKAAIVKKLDEARLDELQKVIHALSEGSASETWWRWSNRAVKYFEARVETLQATKEGK